MRRSLAIRTRLTLWYGTVLAAIVVALGVIVWISAAAILRSSLDEALRVQAADVRAGMDRAVTVAITRLDPAQPGIFTAIFGARGDLRLHSPGFPFGVRPSPVGGVTDEPIAGSDPVAVLAEAAPDDETIVVGSSLAPVDHNLDSLARLLVGTGAAGVVASLAGG